MYDKPSHEVVMAAEQLLRSAFAVMACRERQESSSWNMRSLERDMAKLGVLFDDLKFMVDDDAYLVDDDTETSETGGIG